MTSHSLSPADLAKMLDRPVPTPEQANVIAHGLNPLLVVAGAGSGKTETMTSRAVYLIATRQVVPERVLGLTFTRKAAAELRTRVAQRVNELARIMPDLEIAPDAVPEVATYNSFASRIVSDYAAFLGHDPDARLISEADRFQLMSDIVTSWDSEMEIEAKPDEIITAALSLSDHLSSHGLEVARAHAPLVEDIEARLAHADESFEKKKGKHTSFILNGLSRLEDRHVLLDIVERFNERKAEEGLVDFGDHMRLATRIVTQPDSPVREDLRSRFDAIFLDEYQDTSYGQAKLLSSLFSGRGVTAVGDPNQAIYSWRGASQAALHDFHRDFQGTATLTLSTAWRNDSRILKAANALAAPLRERPEYWQPEAGGHDMPGLVLEPRPQAGEGTVYAGTFATDEDEARGIAEYLVQHWAPWRSQRSCAILCRKRAQMPQLAQALHEQGLPVVMDPGGLLFEPAVRDVHAALAVTADASRGDHLIRLVTNLGIGPADIACLWAHARALAGEAEEQAGAPQRSFTAYLLEAIDNPPPVGYTPPGAAGGFTEAAHARIDRLGAALRELRRHASDRIPALVRRAIEALNVDIDAQSNPLTPAAGRVLAAFEHVAASYDARGAGASLAGFVAWIEAASRRERGLESVAAETAPGAIQLITVHAAKGLEWDVVIVPGMADKVFPTAHRSSRQGLVGARAELPPSLRGDAAYLPDWDFDSNTSASALEKAYSQAEKARHRDEERRLAYVAMTRARSSLVLTHAWCARGLKQVRDASPFLDDIADTLAPMPGVNPAERPSSAQTQEPQTGVAWEEPRLFAPLRDAGVAVAEAIDSLARAHGGLEAARAELADLLRPGRLATATGGLAEELKRYWGHRAGELSADVVRTLAGAAEASTGSPLALPGRLPATSVTKLAADETLAAFIEQLRRPLPAASSRAAQLGTLFHTWVATLLRSVRFRGGRRDADEAFADMVGDIDAGVKARLDRLIERFDALDFFDRYRPIEVEWDVACYVDDTTLACRIDALVENLETGEWAILDWKTDSPHGFAKRRESYITQVGLYRYVATRMGVTDMRPLGVLLCPVQVGAVIDVGNEAASVDAMEEHVRRVLTRAREEARRVRVY